MHDGLAGLTAASLRFSCFRLDASWCIEKFVAVYEPEKSQSYYAAKDEVSDRVVVGCRADDYVVKPFSVE